jgi:hypothetical protein
VLYISVSGGAWCFNQNMLLIHCAFLCKKRLIFYFFWLFNLIFLVWNLLFLCYVYTQKCFSYFDFVLSFLVSFRALYPLREKKTKLNCTHKGLDLMNKKTKRLNAIIKYNQKVSAARNILYFTQKK